VPLSRHYRVDARPARQPHRDVVRQHRERAALAKEGKLRALAITSIRRSMLAPDLRRWRNRLPRLRGRAVVRPARTDWYTKDVIDRFTAKPSGLAMPEVRKSSTNSGSNRSQYAGGVCRRSSTKGDSRMGKLIKTPASSSAISLIRSTATTLKRRNFMANLHRVVQFDLPKRTEEQRSQGGSIDRADLRGRPKG